MKLYLPQIANVLGHSTLPACWIHGAAIDSRKVKAGDLFVALSGTQSDGHYYLDAAQAAGAVAALVQEKQASTLPQIVVKDVKQAFAKIAAEWRRRCQATVIAVTGSNGKTTVKEMIAAILKQTGTVVATEGNLNNELGVPLTLCRLEQDTKYAVIEMGANRPGEIKALTQIVQPHVGVITTISPAHLEGFGSMEGVARAKAEIYAGLNKNGTAVVNLDLPYAHTWKDDIQDKQCVTFALENDAQIRARRIELMHHASRFEVIWGGDTASIQLALPGRHNIANALAAMAAVSPFGIDIQVMKQGLESMQSVPHRLQLRHTAHGAVLIDDSYNANPGSFTAALQVLTGCPGQHWLVLGDMAELGKDSQAIHEEMGRQARQAGVSRVLTLGEKSQWCSRSFGAGATHFATIEALYETLDATLTADVTCLIKGSRMMALDKLADQLAITGVR